MDFEEKLIYIEEDGTLSFGNFELKEKKKLADFPYNGDTYKVKTFSEITKLEKNEGFLYESVPGTTVTNFEETENGISFTVDCAADAQITLGLEQNAIYRININGDSAGTIETGIGGKLSFSINDTPGGSVYVDIVKV